SQHLLSLLSLLLRHPPLPTLFPYTTLFRSWTRLPRDRRPRLYLHGLSLGAMNSQRSAQLFEMIGDPIDGAVWSGPPFESALWRSDRKSTRLNSSHVKISYAVFCLKKKKIQK